MFLFLISTKLNSHLMPENGASTMRFYTNVLCFVERNFSDRGVNNSPGTLFLRYLHQYQAKKAEIKRLGI